MIPKSVFLSDLSWVCHSVGQPRDQVLIYPTAWFSKLQISSDLVSSDPHLFNLKVSLGVFINNFRESLSWSPSSVSTWTFWFPEALLLYLSTESQGLISSLLPCNSCDLSASEAEWWKGGVVVVGRKSTEKFLLPHFPRLGQQLLLSYPQRSSWGCQFGGTLNSDLFC